MTSSYSLIAYRPYEQPDYLFTGSEADLRDFINRNRGVNTYTTATGRKIESPSVAGYLLDDLEVVIYGPDVREYFE